MTRVFMDLAGYDAGTFDRGRPRVVECLWRGLSGVVFQSPFCPWYGLKRWILRRFGARVGRGVLIKPRVTITFPWRLEIGDHSWIGEGVWLDSLAWIRIGKNVCVSQNSYLCTGNHNFRSERFELMTAPIEVADQAWISAGCIVGPGVRVGEGAVLGLGSVATENLEPAGIYRGNPAQRVGDRKQS